MRHHVVALPLMVQPACLCDFPLLPPLRRVPLLVVPVVQQHDLVAMEDAEHPDQHAAIRTWHRTSIQTGLRQDGPQPPADPELEPAIIEWFPPFPRADVDALHREDVLNGGRQDCLLVLG